jgi:hypothetical protein
MCNTNSGYYNTLREYISNLTDDDEVRRLKEGCSFISLRGDEYTSSG